MTEENSPGVQHTNEAFQEFVWTPAVPKNLAYTFIPKNGFKPFKSDPCAYIYALHEKKPSAGSAGMGNVSKNTSKGHDSTGRDLTAILTHCVGDLLLIGRDNAILKILKKRLTGRL